MNYEEKYKEALNKVKSRMENSVGGCLYEDDIIEIFPELAESEDEKIRKEIISIVKSYRKSCITEGNHRFDNCIAWLEMQNHDGKKWIYEDVYIKEKEEIYQDGVDNVLENPQKYGLEKQGQVRKITHEEICKSYGIPDIGEFSDGYHTFNGLYKQRMILFAVLVKTYKDKAWKSWKHEDGLDCFGGGWFIVGIDTPAGTYTYHYEAKDWDRFDCQILEKAKHWDGHDEFDVERLFSLVSNETISEYGIKENGSSCPTKPATFSGHNSSVNLEPKFKVGDWCIDNEDDTIFQIMEVLDNTYTYKTNEGKEYSCPHYPLEIDARIWTIQDAKEGDVLAFDWTQDNGASHWQKIVIFKGLNKDGIEGYGNTFKNGKLASQKEVPHYSKTWTMTLQPATKEQRDLLFQKMKETGYEWDAEKKELKKIEQNPTYKVEPKFKVGDWVVFKNRHQSIYQIETIKDGYYILRHIHGGTIRLCVLHDEDIRLWTIEDAKDGDVLANKDGAVFINNGSSSGGGTLDCYCYISILHKFYIEDHKTGSWFYKDDTKPASKKQRDLLFQKMEEAGYTWDAEKKQLIKIV